MKFGVKGNNDIYEIVYANENTKTLIIKEDIKFKVAIAGMLKGERVTLEEMDNILAKNPIEGKGIYVQKKSQEKFINLIKQFATGTYEFNDDGYLNVISDENINEFDEKLTKYINSQKLYIIDFSGVCYTVDDVTGEVVDYPFEDMDPYQVYQSYTNKDGSKEIIFVTTNEAEKLSSKEIFNEVTLLE